MRVDTSAETALKRDPHSWLGRRLGQLRSIPAAGCPLLSVFPRMNHEPSFSSRPLGSPSRIEAIATSIHTGRAFASDALD